MMTFLFIEEQKNHTFSKCGINSQYQDLMVKRLNGM